MEQRSPRKLQAKKPPKSFVRFSIEDLSITHPETKKAGSGLKESVAQAGKQPISVVNSPRPSPTPARAASPNLEALSSIETPLVIREPEPFEEPAPRIDFVMSDGSTLLEAQDKVSITARFQQGDEWTETLGRLPESDRQVYSVTLTHERKTLASYKKVILEVVTHDNNQVKLQGTVHTRTRAEAEQWTEELIAEYLPDSDSEVDGAFGFMQECMGSGYSLTALARLPLQVISMSKKVLFKTGLEHSVLVEGLNMTEISLYESSVKLKKVVPAYAYAFNWTVIYAAAEREAMVAESEVLTRITNDESQSKEAYSKESRIPRGSPGLLVLEAAIAVGDLTTLLKDSVLYERLSH